MKRQINSIYAILAFTVIVLTSSCLKKDLPEFQSFEDNDITLVNVEHRFNGNLTMNGEPIVAYQKLNVTQTVDDNTSTINVEITVPVTSDEFTDAERDKVSQSKLWFYMNISTAASIIAIEGTPTLGDPTDATKPLKYEVTAANGDSKIWTINVTEFNK